MTVKNEEKSRKPKRKVRTYLYFSLLIAIIISVSVFYFIGKNHYSAEEQIKSFEAAINNNQLDILQTLLQTNHNDFKITEENAASLLTYLTNNNEKLNELIQKWEQQAEGNQKTAHYASIDLVADGKKWLVFDDYQFEVTPAYIHPMANSDLIEFYLNEKLAADIAPLSDKGYGPLMPGQYDLAAVFDNSYSISEQASTIDLYETSVEEVVHSFDFPIEEVVVYAEDEGYFLKVNDEVTSVTLEQGEQSIGEFLTDGSVSLAISKEYPWGEVTSSEQTISSAEEVIAFEVEHSLSTEVRQELMETMNTVFTGYQDALNARDASLLTENVTPNLLKQLEKRIEEVNERYEDYEGTLVKVIYDAKEFNEPEFDEDLDAYVMTLVAHHVFYEPNRSLGYLFVDREKDEYTRANELTVIFNEVDNEWQLNGYRTSYGVITTADEIIFEL